MSNVKNIIFDLGGVIITLDRTESVKRFLEIGVSQAEELLDPYHQKGIFLELEEGRLSEAEFYNELRRITGKNFSDDDIRYGWFGFMKEVPAYKMEMLEKLRKNFKLYLLSNTNPVVMSWATTPMFSEKGRGIQEYFDKLYLSYEIGVTKPNRKIFEYVFDDSGINPEETLFIDDGKSNIEMGKTFGMKTYQPENGEDFRHIFNENCNSIRLN